MPTAVRSTANPRYANGARRRKLQARILREEHDCAICGEPVDKSLATPHPDSAEIDEITPISQGGSPYDRNNTRLTHRQCNRCRSTGRHQGICRLCTTNQAATIHATYITTRTW